MPPKRRGAQAKAANPTAKVTPTDLPKQQPSSKSAPISTAPPIPSPPPPPPPPPPQPMETDSAKVRKEWSKFIDGWYEPQKKKLVEKLQRELLIKYKDIGSPRETQKMREMELFERVDSIAQQLAQPARVEWERRLELAQLHEDQWDDMTGEEQQEVMSVFVGFVDDLEDFDDGDVPAEPSSVEDESIAEEPHYRVVPSHTPGPSSAPPAPLAPSRHPIPPTPTRGNFEFVNPSSFFTDTMTPPNPSKNLPALSMDHLATLGPSNAGRSAEPVSANVGSTLGFQNWASEAGIMTQQPQGQSPKPHSSSTSAQTLSARPRATDNMSRQVSATSNSSPPMKTSSPQYSPPNLSTKFSPSTNAENLPLGKRYIGPIIAEESDPLDEELLKSKMSSEYQQFKISLRIQMIYQFHAEAAEVEIKLFETLLAGEGTKESRARAVQEHETNMMRLREQKEEERKRLCAEERERKREEIWQQLAHRRCAQNREADLVSKENPQSKLGSDKTPLVQQRPAKITHQKENVPLPQPAVAPSTKLEPPGVIKKSNSTLSQDEAFANEALFANAMATMAQGKAGVAGLTPAQASLNEAIFSNASAMLGVQGQQPASSNLQLPGVVKKSSSFRSQEYDIPQITVSFTEAPTITPELAQVSPPITANGKKSSRGRPAVQPPPGKPVVITEESEMGVDAESPASVPSLWDATSVAAKNMWGSASASFSASKAKVNMSAEEVCEPELITKAAQVPTKGIVNAKKVVQPSKKGKKVTITEELDVDAVPIMSPPPSAKSKTTTKGGWGSVNAKPKAVPPVTEERESEPAPAPPPATPVGGNKKSPIQTPAKASVKPQLKVSILEEQESEFESSLAPAWTNKAASKSARGTGVAVLASTLSGKKGTPAQMESRRGPQTPGPKKSARMETVPDPEEEGEPLTMAPGDSSMPGALGFADSREAATAEKGEDDEGDVNPWFDPENISYWANFMASQPEEGTLVAPQSASEQMNVCNNGQHMLWTPTVSRESEDEEEVGEADDELATSMWMQYAISGGNIHGLGGAPEVPLATTVPTPPQSAQRDAGLSIWEQGKGKKALNTSTADVGNRAQQTSVSDRAAFTGQWPKKESWLSPPARGQSSGSARVF